MATRLILALLALLTGLSVQDASARTPAVMEGRAQVGAVCGAQTAQHQPAGAVLAVGAQRAVLGLSEGAFPVRRAGFRWHAAAVLPGIDRAHE